MAVLASSPPWAGRSKAPAPKPSAVCVLGRGRRNYIGSCRRLLQGHFLSLHITTSQTSPLKSSSPSWWSYACWLHGELWWEWSSAVLVAVPLPCGCFCQACEQGKTGSSWAKTMAGLKAAPWINSTPCIRCSLGILKLFVEMSSPFLK